MNKWNTEDTIQWLRSKDAAQEIIDLCEDQELKGDSFISLSLKDIRELAPDIKAGKILPILKERDSFVEMQTSHHSETSKEETFRIFDKAVDISFKYNVNAILPQPQTRPDDLINPVHNYVDMSSVALEEQLFRFGCESVRFANACLNERTNGTLHFGISTEGKVVGLSINKYEYGEILTQFIDSCFEDHQIDIVKHCVRPPKFVQVISRQADKPLFIVEVDIVPKFELTTDESFSMKMPTLKKTKTVFTGNHLFKFDDNGPVEIKQVQAFMKSLDKLSKLRKDGEDKRQNKHVSPNLRKQLVNLLCRGDDDMNNDTYPILIINRPEENMDHESMSKQLSFLKDIKWRAVFDLDGRSSDSTVRRFVEDCLEMSTKLYTTNDFDSDHSDNIGNNFLKERLKDISNSTEIIPWIYVNEFEDMSLDHLDQMEWKRKRKEGFKECVHFFKQEIPKGRALVVHLLLSKDYDVLIEVADSICSVFTDQWMLIAKNDGIADPFLSNMSQRNIGTSQYLKERSVIGMPWSQVQETVKQLVGENIQGVCKVRTSTGAYVEIREKMLNDLCDLEILSSDQCDNSEIIKDKSRLQEHNLKMEKLFYKGETVDWWNFWFQNHVLERSQHSQLLQQVEEALNNNEDHADYVSSVRLYHQPGAGGTTSVRNILWDLRTKYRCAVVKNITDQTHVQISKLHTYEENRAPKPVILLFDNVDEEKLSDLQCELEYEAKVYARSHDQVPNVFYVLLECVRKTDITEIPKDKYTVLKHELKPIELCWFQNRSKELEKTHQSPQLMISFNILKENFNERYIKETVTKLVAEITIPEERDFLMYIALLNTYDVKCQSVPAAAFDVLMEEHPYSKRSSYKKLWENHLSTPLKILLNEPSQQTYVKFRSFCMITSLLSKAVLDELRGGQTVGDVTETFIKSAVFRQMSGARNFLLKIMRDTLKFRTKNLSDSESFSKFSPLILQILSNEKNADQCFVLLDTVFKLSTDPFILQHSARLYLHLKRWKEAEVAAKEAVHLRKDNSYLLDTLGQVYKAQVIEAFKAKLVNVSSDDALKVVNLGFQAIDTFKQEQVISKIEISKSMPNHFGYIGEVDAVIRLLRYLESLALFEGKETFHLYLVDESYIPNALQHWDFHCHVRLKHIYNHVDIALNHLEDEFMQLKDSNHFQKQSTLNTKSQVMRLRKSIQHFYGEQIDQIPDKLSDAEACKYRRRRILRIAGSENSSLEQLYDLRWKENAPSNLLNVRSLAEENISKGKLSNEFDFKTLIGVTLSLASHPDFNKHLSDKCFREMVEYSRHLYFHSTEASGLEPYLFLYLFNWPRSGEEDRQIGSKHLLDALFKWKSAYHQKYPKQKTKFRKKDTVLFFLGKGDGMKSIAHFEELQSLHMQRGIFWNSAQVRNRLRRLDGLLVNNGTEIKVTLPEISKNLLIPTAVCLTDRTLFYRKVYFVLGFSFAGPIAYNVENSCTP